MSEAIALMPRSLRSPLLSGVTALLLTAGCNAPAFFAGNPATSPSPGVFNGPTPPPLSACAQPIVGDQMADPWLRANLSGTVRDTDGTAVTGATIKARITQLGDMLELRKAIPPTSRDWYRSADGERNCVQMHVLVMGDFTKFADGSDSASATSGPDGRWTLERAPAGATLELTVTKDGYAPLLTTVVAQQNPDKKPELNRLTLTVTRP